MFKVARIEKDRLAVEVALDAWQVRIAAEVLKGAEGAIAGLKVRRLLDSLPVRLTARPPGRAVSLRFTLPTGVYSVKVTPGPAPTVVYVTPYLTGLEKREREGGPPVRAALYGGGAFPAAPRRRGRLIHWRELVDDGSSTSSFEIKELA